MYRATDAGRVNLSNVKSEPIIGASRPWGGSFQERVGRFASVGIIRPKYRRPKPNTLFGVGALLAHTQLSIPPLHSPILFPQKILFFVVIFHCQLIIFWSR